jgi:hypothetical protein
LGLVAAFNLAASSTVLTASEAEAQTAGMERRQERQAEGMRAPGFGLYSLDYFDRRPYAVEGKISAVSVQLK